MEVPERHDPIIFENVADQYAKGEDVTVFFTILRSTKINLEEDRIGLIRVGCTNIKECLSYTSVQFNSSIPSESFISGTATFPSSSLIATADEFYQFCYINNKTKNLGSSIPFQLNCTLDDIDFLSSISTEKPLYHQVNNISNGMPSLIRSPKTTVSRLSFRQQSISEDDHAKALNEIDRLRSQLNVTRQLAQDQATQILDLERRLIQSNELIKTSNQNRTSLEQQLRDLHLTFEKYQRSTQGQLNIHANTERQSRDLLLTSEKRQRSMQGQLNAYLDVERQLRDLRLTSEKYQRSTQGQLNMYSKQRDPNQQAYAALKASFTEIEKRCVKHQKNEIDLKRQLNIHQNSINDFQDEIQYLNERLSASTEDYKILFRKYNASERQRGGYNEQEKVHTFE